MISPLRPASCRFIPTCSQYAVDALNEYGVIRGGWFIAARLLKCGHHGTREDGTRYPSATPAGATAPTPAMAGSPQQSKGRVSLLHFDPFSLDIIYYPVSGSCGFGTSLRVCIGPGSKVSTWALSVVFLVFTLRAGAVQPFVRQIRTPGRCRNCSRRSRRCRRSTATTVRPWRVEMQKLQREHGFNPLLGCLPCSLQVPVFLASITCSGRSTGTGGSRLHGLRQDGGMTVEPNANTANYVFGAAEVGHSCAPDCSAPRSAPSQPRRAGWSLRPVRGEPPHGGSCRRAVR